MMATAAQVITAALKRILVQADEAPLEASEYQDAVDALNNMMLAWDAEGITLGYTEIADLGDEVTVPTGALRAVISNLALEVAPDYGGEVSDVLVASARRGMVAARIIGQEIPTTRYPDTLPRGSGNEKSTTYASFHFYPGLEAEILAETTGAIGLEESTNTVANGGTP